MTLIFRLLWGKQCLTCFARNDVFLFKYVFEFSIEGCSVALSALGSDRVTSDQNGTNWES
jgi:hypothetical protein